MWAWVAYSVSLLEYGSLSAGATGKFKESMEVYPDETPWTAAEIRR